MTELAVGDDGLARCPWPGISAPDYAGYHDREWGVPVHGESALLERICLEAFQSGLSWLTILRRREGFRRAFAGFDADAVAAFGPEDVNRLLQDRGIVRNARKVAATLANARATVGLREQGGLEALVWSFAQSPRRRPLAPGEVPDRTPESVALSRALKAAGFAHVGPVTAYATMQACGLVDDHVAGCHRARR